jgi:hypothetical protein
MLSDGRGDEMMAMVMGLLEKMLTQNVTVHGVACG